MSLYFMYLFWTLYEIRAYGRMKHSIPSNVTLINWRYGTMAMVQGKFFLEPTTYRRKVLPYSSLLTILYSPSWQKIQTF